MNYFLIRYSFFLSFSLFPSAFFCVIYLFLFIYNFFLCILWDTNDNYFSFIQCLVDRWCGWKICSQKKHSRKNERKKYCGFFNALFSIGICIGQIMFAFEACCCCIQIFDSVFFCLYSLRLLKKKISKNRCKKMLLVRFDFGIIKNGKKQKFKITLTIWLVQCV